MLHKNYTDYTIFIGVCRARGQLFNTTHIGAIAAAVPAQVQRDFSICHRTAPVSIQNNSYNLVKSLNNLGITAINVLPHQLQPNRSLTKFSIKKGKRKSVKAVIKRFMRLDWGGWIRTRSGRHKKMWKKSGNLKRRLRQHVLINGTQSWMLDKMVTKFWRKPKYYVDDPYRPYHSREHFITTRKNPIEY